MFQIHPLQGWPQIITNIWLKHSLSLSLSLFIYLFISFSLFLSHSLSISISFTTVHNITFSSNYFFLNDNWFWGYREECDRGRSRVRSPVTTKFSVALTRRNGWTCRKGDNHRYMIVYLFSTTAYLWLTLLTAPSK